MIAKLNTSRPKSFEQYAQEKRQEKILNQRYIDHLLQQLAEARQTPVAPDMTVLNELKSLNEKLAPVTKFFDRTAPIQPKKRISAKERKRLADEEYERKMDLKALAYINEQGG